jgi:endo-1,4-beta-mannosidase
MMKRLIRQPGRAAICFLTRTHLLGLGTCLLLLSCATAGPTPRPGQGFIVREGSHFVLDGAQGRVPVKLLGANTDSIHGRPSQQDVSSLFSASAPYFNTLRIWAVGECANRAPEPWENDFCFRMGPSGWNERAFLALDEMIEAAAASGHRVILVLSNNWSAWGGLPMYYEWFNLMPTPAGQNTAGPTPQQFRFFFGDPRAEASFRALAEKLTQRLNTRTQRRYNEDPTIIAWEMGNELRPPAGVMPLAQAWFERNTRWLRTQVPYQMISTGLETAASPDRSFRNFWASLAGLPEVDYLDLHLYPGTVYRTNPGNQWELRARLGEVRRLAHDVFQKPILFSEIGFGAENAERFQQELPRNERLTAYQLLGRTVQSALREFEFDGVLVWLMSRVTGGDREFAVDPRKPEFQALFRGPLGIQGLRQDLGQAVARSQTESEGSRR